MKVKKNTLILIVVIILSILVGNRGSTPDTTVYYDIFKNINSYHLYNYSQFYLESGVELGWGLYSKFISFFTSSSFILFGLFSFITFFTIYKSNNILNLPFIYSLAFYLPSTFFLMQQFMQIRQGLSIPAAILASFLYVDNRKKESILFFLIAIMFHQTSFAYIFIFIVYLILIKYYKIDLSVRRFFIILISILIGGFFLARIIFLPLAFSFFERLDSYANSDYSESYDLLSLSNIKFYIELLLIIILTNDRILKNKFYSFMVFIFIVGLTIRIAFYDFGILGGRLSVVFLFIEIFLIPFLLVQRLNINFVRIYMVFYFLFIFYITWVFQVSSYLEDSYFVPLG